MQHVETSSTHHRDRCSDDNGAHRTLHAERTAWQGDEGTYRQTDVEKNPKQGDNEETKEGCKESQEESLRTERHHQGSQRDTDEKEHDVEESRSRSVLGKKTVVGVAEQESGERTIEQENHLVESSPKHARGQETARVVIVCVGVS